MITKSSLTDSTRTLSLGDKKLIQQESHAAARKARDAADDDDELLFSV